MWRAWRIDEAALDRIEIGAGILGTGGGGNPYLGKLWVRELLRQGKTVEVVRLADVPDEALVTSVGGMGAPVIGFERLIQGQEYLTALRALEAHLGREDDGRTLVVDFQNENLIARDDAGAILAVVPDLICLVAAETAEPVTTEVLRFGLRVDVLGIPAPALLKTPAALAVVGPAAFGYWDVPYVPLPGRFAEGLTTPRATPLL